MKLAANSAEELQRDTVIGAVASAVTNQVPVKLPPPDPRLEALSLPAPLPVLRTKNQFGGAVGEYLYQFEGEEDLIHLIVAKADFSPLAVSQAHEVVAFLLPQFPPALLWLRPGDLSHHFYLGLDEFLGTVTQP